MTQSKVIVSNLRGWCNNGYWVTTLQHGSLEHWVTWPERTFAKGTECWPENLHHLYLSEGCLSCILLPQKRYWGCGCSHLPLWPRQEGHGFAISLDYIARFRPVCLHSKLHHYIPPLPRNKCRWKLSFSTQGQGMGDEVVNFHSFLIS